MYVFIDDEYWSANGRPPLVERHGELVDPATGVLYGHELLPAEQLVAGRALYDFRHPLEPSLFD